MSLLKNAGCDIRWTGEHQVTTCAGDASSYQVDRHLIRSFRASILLLGPFLSRFGTITIPEPGGCLIGNRPLDAHFED